MGILGNFLGKGVAAEEKGAEGEKEPQKSPDAEQVGKYDEPCSLCGAAGTEKKWAGKYWHVRCMRKIKKAARGML